jgi:hypothetical protein
MRVFGELPFKNSNNQTGFAKTAKLSETSISNYMRLKSKERRELYRLKKATTKPRLAGLSFFVKNILGFDSGNIFGKYTKFFTTSKARTPKEIEDSLAELQQELEGEKNKIKEGRKTALTMQEKKQIQYIELAQKQLQNDNNVKELVNEMLRKESNNNKKANNTIKNMFADINTKPTNSLQIGGNKKNTKYARYYSRRSSRIASRKNIYSRKNKHTRKHIHIHH